MSAPSCTPMARAALAAVVAHAVVCLLSLTGCRFARSELRVQVTSDFDYGPGRTVEAVRLTVRDDAAGPPVFDRVVRVAPPGEAGEPLPLTLTLTPAREAVGTAITVEAVACRDALCTDVPRARARAVTSYVAGERRLLRLELSRECEEIECDAPQTCDPTTRACVSSAVVAAQLAPVGGDGGATGTAPLRVLQLVAGGATTCARMSDRTVRCWGGGPDPFDALATPDERAVDGVTPVPGATDTIDLSVGEGHACAVREDGSVLCWGRNDEGQLGTPDGTHSAAAREVTGVHDAVRIAAGAGFTCALRLDATVSCWGLPLTREAGARTMCTDSEAPRVARRVPGLDGVVRLSAGGAHACAVDRDGAVWCWGAGGDAALGQSSRCDAREPTRVTGLPPARDVAAGRSHSCALLRSGGVYCWGLSVFGQSSVVARVGGSDVQVPARVAGLESVVELRAGRDHSCARRADGAAFCWGRNDAAQLGGGVSTPVALTRVAGVGPLTAIAPAAEHTCARDERSGVWCWGRDALGQLGVRRTRSEPAVRTLADRSDPSGAPFVTQAAAAGVLHSCALDGQGVRCWGLTQAGGQPRRDGLGADGSRMTEVAPQQTVGLPAAASDLALGRDFSCARYDDGAVRCWGNNRLGQLGDGSRVQQPFPVRVRSVIATHGLAIGRSHACAIANDRGVWCWGFNNSGQAGAGSTSASVTTPVRLSGLEGVTGLALGWFHSCALSRDGDVYCWGENRLGELGVGDVIPRTAPTRVDGLERARIVRAGVLSTCAVVGENEVYCWGQMLPRNASVPTRVGGTRTDARIVDLAISGATQCALYADGTLECWGDNRNGQMLVTSIDSTQTPTRASTPVRFASITAGAEFFCGVERDTGAVYCWGEGSTGQLGDGAYRSTNRRAPAVTRVQGLGLPARLVAARDEHACALLLDRSVRCWGDNASGQLGVGTPTDTTRPVEVTTLPAVRDVSTAERHSCAIDQSGGTWCWGANESGQLGIGDAERALTPRPVVSSEGGAPLDRAIGVSASSTHSCAVRDDGSVWCWGANESGQLGDGSLAPSRGAVRALFVDNATAVRTSTSKTCAVLRSGAVACWGLEWSGINQIPRTVPHAVTGVDHVRDLALGANVTCVLRDAESTSRVECWGVSSGGLLGPVSLVAGVTSTPQHVPGLDGSVALAPSFADALCAVGSEGAVRCWGRVFALIANIPVNTVWNTPESVAISEARSVDMGPAFACATRSDGAAWCWGGDNDQGELGDGGTEGHRDPRPVLGLDHVEQLSVAGRHGCARRTTRAGEPSQGQLWCWGSNATGQLGIGERSAEPQPPLAASVSADSVQSLSAGFGHSCALLKNGRVWCWGGNGSGALGAGDRFDSPVARAVVGLVDRAGAPAAITGISTGIQHSCAWATGQSDAWCWGANESGQLGGDTRPTLVARRTPLPRAPVALAAGGAHTCAIDDEETLWCWGRGERGQLGDGARTSRVAPARVPGLAGVRAVATGGAHTCALDARGAVHCWGANNRGQLGDGTHSDRASPVRVAGVDDAIGLVASRDVRCTRVREGAACATTTEACATRVEERCAASAEDFTCALRRDRTVACWGANDRRQLGDGTNTDRSGPVAVRGLASVDGGALIAGGRHACVRRPSGSLECWGDDAWGQLGSTGDVLRATPTAVIDVAR